MRWLPNPLRVLLVTETLDDVREFTAALRGGGFDLDVEWVLTPKDLEAALSRGPWDAAVAVPLLPSYNSYAALSEIRRRGLDIPFVLVSDGSEEAIATNTMRAGADEYLLRDELHRLPLILERSIRENATHSTRRLAERALRRAEELTTRLEKVLDNSSNEVYFFDAVSFHFIEVNGGAARNLGYPRRELPLLTPLAFKPEFTFQSFAALLEPLRSGEKDLVTIQTVHRRRDGSTYPVESRIQFSRSEEPPVFVEIAQDITDRKRAEERLHHRLDQLQTLSTLSEAVARAESLPEIYAAAISGLLRAVNADRAAVLIRDGDGRVRAEATWRLSAAFKAALEDPSLLWGAGTNPHRDAPTVITHVRESVTSPLTAPCLAEGIGAIVLIPLLSQEGFLGACAVAFDRPRPLTEIDLPLLQTVASTVGFGVARKRADEVLRRSEERYRLLVEGVRDYAVFALDKEGNVANWNAGAARILGYTTDEILGAPFATFFPPEAVAEGRPANALRTAARVGAYEEDGWRIRKDGGAIWAHGVTTALRDGDGALIGFSKMVRDLTDRRRAEEALEISRRQVAISEKLTALGTLVSGVAHEIRTPLTYLKNNLFLLTLRLERLARSDPALREPVKELLDLSRAAGDGADRINYLVKNLRQSAKLDPGRRVRTGLVPVVAESVELFEATHRGRVEVVTDFQPTVPLDLIREQIQQVVLNLLLNAAESMPQGGRVWVSTGSVPGGAEVAVEDEGVGMKPEIQSRLFDPFFTTKTEGTGLGLSISKRIVEAHGGAIRFDTEPGRGTRFTVFIPGAPPSPALAGDAPSLAQSSGP